MAAQIRLRRQQRQQREFQQKLFENPQSEEILREWASDLPKMMLSQIQQQQSHNDTAETSMQLQFQQYIDMTTRMQFQKLAIWQQLTAAYQKWNSWHENKLCFQNKQYR